MLTEYREGALTVIEAAHTKDHVQRELQALDPRLFAEKQLTFENYPVWCVCFDLGERAGAQRIFTIHEHRDANGTPIGYPTMKMVDEIKRMMQRGAIDVKDLDKRNMEKREARRKEIYGDLRERARERQASAHPIYSALLPRGRSLQRSRQRGREQVRQATVMQQAVAKAKRERGIR